MLLRNKMFLSLFTIFLITPTGSESQICKKFEVYSEFGNKSCERNCNNYWHDELDCYSDTGDCLCKEPNVRDTHTDECISTNECEYKKNEISRRISESRKCNAFEFYMPNVDKINEWTCDNYMEKDRILYSGLGACFCKTPNVRDNLTNECINIRECSRRKEERNKKKCGMFEEYLEKFDKRSEMTCDNFMNDRLYLLGSGGCFCKVPTVRDVVTNECILVRECLIRQKKSSNSKISNVNQARPGFTKTMKNYYSNAKNKVKSWWNNYIG
ncbi:uncharacterized protein LOC127280913 [Leptopilina boulardi]|uniref:uncharacterized protein LOC127280913 n=1 Tax=Leptopilina boulardi TaxID=63433 RepID=UPI0021F5859A|nr:uncharacterized protein LOC127280913 [Leptopilina boulardi]